MTDEEIARAFHEAYERLAPSFGYSTREASAKPWDDVPADNRALMVATVGEVRALLAPAARARVAELEADNMRLRTELAVQRQAVNILREDFGVNEFHRRRGADR